MPTSRKAKRVLYKKILKHLLTRSMCRAYWARRWIVCISAMSTFRPSLIWQLKKQQQFLEPDYQLKHASDLPAHPCGNSRSPAMHVPHIHSTNRTMMISIIVSQQWLMENKKEKQETWQLPWPRDWWLWEEERIAADLWCKSMRFLSLGADPSALGLLP